jgi:hypothetical protein
MAAGTTARKGSAAGGARLTVVACPLVPAELDAAVRNLAQWDEDWARASMPPDPQVRPLLLFVFNVARDPALELRLVEAWQRAGRVRAAFRDLEVLFLDLPADKNLYVRDPSGPVPPYGFKSGPNWMFYEALRYARMEGGFMFLMEVDCRPMVPTWLSRLDRTCQRHDDAWVIGAHYSGASPLVSNLARHINGNALYHVGDEGFARFVDDFFWPWMERHIREQEPSLAYDCAWETFIHRAEMGNTAHPDWHLAREILHRFRLTSHIVNIAGHAEQKGAYAWTRKQLLERFPQVAVVHGPIADDGAHRRGALNVGRPSVRDMAVDGEQARFLSNDARYSRSLWLQDADFRPGQQVIVRARISDPHRRRLQIQIKDATGTPVEVVRSPQATVEGREAKATFTLAGAHRYLFVHFRPIGALEAEAGLAMAEVKVAVREDDRQLAHLRDLLQ